MNGTDKFGALQLAIVVHGFDHVYEIGTGNRGKGFRLRFVCSLRHPFVKRASVFHSSPSLLENG